MINDISLQIMSVIIIMMMMMIMMVIIIMIIITLKMIFMIKKLNDCYNDNADNDYNDSENEIDIHI